MFGLEGDAGLMLVDGPEEWGAVTRRLHFQNLAMAWQFAGRFTSEELSQLWTATREALHGWKIPERASPR